MAKNTERGGPTETDEQTEMAEEKGTATRALEFSAEKLAKTDEDPLMRESDRGLVLMCASDLENALETLLGIWFQKAGGASGRKKSDAMRASANSFSAKMQLASVLGLTTSEIDEDLQSIRKIRNRAAHEGGTFSLSDDEIVSSVEQLNHSLGDGDLARYKSKVSEPEPEPVQDDGPLKLNESFMKGCGFVRYDKVNFVLAFKRIGFELKRLHMVASLAGSMVSQALDVAGIEVEEMLRESRERKASETAEPHPEEETGES